MNAPELEFAVVSQHAIGKAVRALCGEAVRDWSEYHLDRYGWLPRCCARTPAYGSALTKPSLVLQTADAGTE